MKWFFESFETLCVEPRAYFSLCHSERCGPLNVLIQFAALESHMLADCSACKSKRGLDRTILRWEFWLSVSCTRVAGLPSLDKTMNNRGSDEIRSTQKGWRNVVVDKDVDTSECSCPLYVPFSVTWVTEILFLSSTIAAKNNLQVLLICFKWCD